MTLAKDVYCDALRGNPDDGVCMVDDFPAPYDKLSACASIPTEAIAEPKREGFVLHMKPQDAKKLFPPTILNQDTVERLRKRYRNKQPVCPPWLEICFSQLKTQFPPAESCFVGHEGRHRIEAAIREGLKTIPIIVRSKPSYACPVFLKEKI